MASPTTLRFSDSVRTALTAYAHRTGRTRSAVVNEAVAEWLAMQAHPRVRFVSVETGERRAVVIDGPEVWTVAEAWLAHEATDRDTPTIADALGLDPVTVEVALAYWADHRDEIDQLLARHWAAQDAALAAWERRQSLQQA